MGKWKTNNLGWNLTWRREWFECELYQVEAFKQDLIKAPLQLNGQDEWK